MEQKFTFLASVEADGQRVDSFLAAESDWSRSYIKKLADEGRVFRCDTALKVSDRVRPGDVITLTVPEAQEIALGPENIPLDIVYEDKDLIIVNKPKGMVVHPAAGNPTGTLVNALLYHCGDLSGIGGALRPGIVHRIDKETSGLIMAAKNDFSHQSLSCQISSHTAGRVYWALVEGVVKQDQGTIAANIGRHPTDRKKMAIVSNGRSAVTDFRVLERFPHETLVECRLHTGRTHQIRVHMASIGHPVVGDRVYGFKKQRYSLEGQLLHAKELHLRHPRTDEPICVNAPLPEDFRRILEKLGSKSIGDPFPSELPKPVDKQQNL